MWVLFGIGFGIMAIVMNDAFTLVLSIGYLYIAIVGSKKEESKSD